MALRKIRLQGDEVLAKVSRPVEKMTPRIHDLIGDMLETMYDAMGVGLAAPQVGMLKRIVVIDIGEGPIVLINPEILETSGEQTGDEGCLSVPGMAGQCQCFSSDTQGKSTHSQRLLNLFFRKWYLL